MITTRQLINEINAQHERSAWGRGVNQYAVELAASVGEVVGDWQAYTFDELKSIALNGASDWKDYSEGGYALVYNYYICERLATPSEVKRTCHGALSPNKHESWIDVQSRALYQAWDYIEFILHYKFGMPLC